MKQTTEQAAILAERSSFRVLAGAGSGKTTTMTHYVKAAIKDYGIGSSTICFVTFTRFAADHIRAKCSEVLGHSHEILCGTFHSVIYRLLKRGGCELPPSKNLFDSRMEGGIQHFLKLLRERNPSLVRLLSQFRLLIVDEFQDVDEIQFEFITLFKAIQPALQILAIGDLAQNIYRFRGTSNEFLRTRLQAEVEAGLKSFTLTTNFRSSPAILRFCNTLFEEEIREGHILPLVARPGCTEEGVKPFYYEYAINPGKGVGEYEELVAQTLVPLIQKAKAARKSLVIILPMLKTASFQLLMALLRRTSQKVGYSFDLHQIAKEDETCSTVSFGYDPRSPEAPVQFSSFHSSKGLEWDIVALVNVSDDMYYLREGQEDCEAFYAERTNLLYVGVTRAIEELHIFANANCGGRHRHLARLGEGLEEHVKFTAWGTEAKEYEYGRPKPISVTALLRKLPQHPDLWIKAKELTEMVPSVTLDGGGMERQDVYEAMKMRNREMALGSFLDWKLKRGLCTEAGNATLQDCLLELATAYKGSKWFSRADAFESLDLLLTKVDLFFENASQVPRSPLEKYVIASRILGLHKSRWGGMAPTCRELMDTTEEEILRIVRRGGAKTLLEEYILAQATAFYSQGATTEIQSVRAPCTQYQGLPCEFAEFVEDNMKYAEAVVREVVRVGGGNMGALRGDVPVQTESLIYGEADMVAESGEDGEGGVLLELKCGTSGRAVELRDVGQCKNLLQVFCYVALGRHGLLPFSAGRAALVNPLTGAWEMYDLKAWPAEASAGLVEVLEELRRRG